jgi:hypothetical protein
MDKRWPERDGGNGRTVKLTIFAIVGRKQSRKEGADGNIVRLSEGTTERPGEKRINPGIASHWIQLAMTGLWLTLRFEVLVCHSWSVDVSDGG